LDNWLAVAAKNENDIVRQYFTTDAFVISRQLKRRFPAKQQGLTQMIDTLRRAAALWVSLASVGIVLATPAYSQAPTDAQRSAIRAECRSDYEAHCASVPPGGMASLQCLQKNMSSLSSGCQSAVRAVESPAESKAEPAPATAPGKAESTPAAAPKTESAAAPVRPAAETAAPAAPKAATATTKKPSSAQVTAIRGACRSDYQKVCAGVPTGGAAALQCLEKNRSKVSANCQKAVAALSGSTTPAAAGGAAAATETTASPAAVPAAPALVLRPMLPREELFVLRSACSADARALCAGVVPGGGRIMQCLAVQSASLSPDCRDVLSQFAAQ
jgi:hypothetical protein